MRTGTVRAAAERLRLSHSTIARRMEALEQKLAVRLFDRQPGGYVLTQAGEDMLEVAEQVETEMVGLERRILGHDHKLSGRIRISMVDAFATNLLMSHLSAFIQQYPEIDLEIDVTYKAVDLDYREADLALRFARNPPEHLIGRRLLTCATAAYASNDYIDNNNLLDLPSVSQSTSARWIGFGKHEAFPTWVKQSKFPDIPAKGQIVSLLVQLEACKAGMGIAMLPCFLGEPEPVLQRLSPGEPNSSFELWLLTHRDMRTNARIRVFSDFIVAAVKNQRDLLEGHT